MTKTKVNKRVYMNLIQAEVYARNPEILGDKKTRYAAEKTYPELVEKQLPNGSIYVIEQQPYPVTPESVKSYAATADYRRDIATAMNAQPRGKNLGDLSSVQQVLSADMEAARSLYGSLKKVFETAAPASAPAPEDNGGNE